MLCGMRNRTEPPAEPETPFLPWQTPRMGGLLRPGELLAPPAPAQPEAAPGPPASPLPRPPAAAPAADLGEAAEGLRIELCYFREWLPGQLARLGLPAAIAAPA